VATTGFVVRQVELGILTERFAAAEMGYPQVVHLEGEAGSGKSTLLSRFLGSLPNAVIVQTGGDEDETLVSNGVIDQMEPGVDHRAFKISDTTYGIFDSFETEDAREAHLGGEIPTALGQVAVDLLAKDPEIVTVDVIAVK
jgi:hypothetical protein